MATVYYGVKIHWKELAKIDGFEDIGKSRDCDIYSWVYNVIDNTCENMHLQKIGACCNLDTEHVFVSSTNDGCGSVYDNNITKINLSNASKQQMKEFCKTYGLNKPSFHLIRDMLTCSCT